MRLVAIGFAVSVVLAGCGSGITASAGTPATSGSPVTSGSSAQSVAGGRSPGYPTPSALPSSGTCAKQVAGWLDHEAYTPDPGFFSYAIEDLTEALHDANNGTRAEIEGAYAAAAAVNAELAPFPSCTGRENLYQSGMADIHQGGIDAAGANWSGANAELDAGSALLHQVSPDLYPGVRSPAYPTPSPLPSSGTCAQQVARWLSQEANPTSAPGYFYEAVENLTDALSDANSGNYGNAEVEGAGAAAAAVYAELAPFPSCTGQENLYQSGMADIHQGGIDAAGANWSDAKAEWNAGATLLHQLKMS
jgi:hypothetical protein